MQWQSRNMHKLNNQCISIAKPMLGEYTSVNSTRLSNVPVGSLVPY